MRTCALSVEREVADVGGVVQVDWTVKSGVMPASMMMETAMGITA